MFLEKVTREMQLHENKKDQLLQALAKPQQRKHSVSEIKKVIKMNRKSQKVPRRKLKDVLVKNSQPPKKEK